MSMTYYKLTSQDRRTFGGSVWVPGEWRDAAARPCVPCTPTALHGYTSPELAALLYPAQTTIREPYGTGGPTHTSPTIRHWMRGLRP